MISKKTTKSFALASEVFLHSGNCEFPDCLFFEINKESKK